MPNPTKYQPSYSFTGWQASNPARPLPGQRVDIELQALQLTTDEVIAGLNQIRRSDGRLAGGIVDLASLSDEVRKKLGGSGAGGPIDIDDVTGLQAALDDKSQAGHKHAISAINGLQAALDAKEATANKGQPGGYAGLGADGKVPAAQLPSVAPPNVKDKLTWYVSDLDIPVGDPNRDDRQKLLSLAASVIAAGGGRIVVDVPVRISGAWRFENARDIEIMGRGPGSIEVIPNASSPAVAAIRFLTSERVYVHDIRIFAPDSATRQNMGFTTDAYQCKHVRMERIHATNMCTGPWFGTCDFVWVQDCVILNPRADGIHFALSTRYFACLGNTVINPGDDAFAAGSDFNIPGAPSYPTSDGVFANNYCREGFWGGGVVCYEVYNILIANNQMVRTACSGIVVSGLNEPEHQSVQSLNISIVGNKITRPGQARYVLGDPAQGEAFRSYGNGIFIGDITGCLVADNLITEVTGANQSQDKAGIWLENCADVAVKGNKIKVVNGHGIAGAGNVVGCTFSQNDIDTTQRSGIEFYSTGASLTDYTFIDGNRTRRTNQSGGSGWTSCRVGAGSGVLVFANNLDGDNRAASIVAQGSRTDYKKNNLPPANGETTPGSSYPSDPVFNSIRIVPGASPTDGQATGTFVVGPSGAPRYFDGQFSGARYLTRGDS